MSSLAFQVNFTHKYKTMLFDTNKLTRWYRDIVHRAKISIGNNITDDLVKLTKKLAPGEIKFQD
jgi:hypothetical protein